MSAEAFIQTMKGLILKEISPLLPAWRWGAVSSVSPLTVTLDAGQGVVQGIGTNVAGLKAGDRVQVLTWRSRSRVVGIDGGSPFPAVPPFPVAKDAASTSEVLTGDYTNVANWRALSDGWYYNSSNSMTGMPTSSGFVRVRRRGNEWHVTYYAQPSGPEYRMSLNGASTSVVWERLFQHGERDLAGTQDLSDYTQAGIYHFNQDVTAAGGSNFPVNAAGVLEVMGVGSMRYQRYTAYRNHPGHVYYRNFSGGVWGPWERIGGGVIGGMVTIALPTQGTVGQASVSFPTNRFTSRPNVGLAAWTTAPQTVGYSISTLSATSVLIHAVRTTGTGDLNITWTANG